MKTILFPLAIAGLAVISCKSPEATATASPNQKPETASYTQPTTTGAPASSEAAHEEVMMNDQEKQSDNNYRLIVSFISIGEGTDRNGKATLDGIIDNWKQKTGKLISYEPVSWGREGETDFCFKINELTSKEQELFATDIKTAFNGNQLIQITENQPCIHKR